MDIRKKLIEIEPKILQWRRWFHAHPEESGKEHRTSEKIIQELDRMGISNQRVGRTGVIATIRGRNDKPCLGIRADMDALPIEEKTGLPFQSMTEGLMHACGHDAHIAMLLGVAEVLSSREDLNGTIKLIFQAAEEIGEGTKEIIESLDSTDGLNAIIGLHIWNDIPEGEILLLPGPVFSGVEGFTCRITGQGGHGARPDLVKDPIKAACDLIMKFSSIPSNFYDVLDNSVVSTCMIQSGNKGNVFPSEAIFKGSMRFFKKDAGKSIRAIMENMAAGIERIYGTRVAIDYYAQINPIINDEDLILQARSITHNVDGLQNSPRTDPISASDNFAELVERYGGFYAVLGAGGEGFFPHHHSQFDIDEASIRKGAEFFVRYAYEYFS